MRRIDTYLNAIIVCPFLTMCVPGHLQAYPGDLDTSFGTNGEVITQISGEAHAVAIQPDGKIVTAGHNTQFNIPIGSSPAEFVLTRFNPDGSIDITFGNSGIVTTDFSNTSDDRAFAVVLQPDGKIIAAGTASGPLWSFALSRYNTDGSLDVSFGSGGKVTTDFGGLGSAYAIVLEPDGKIVAAGQHFNVISGFALARYNPDGSLDTSFGSGGKVTTDVNSLNQILALVLQPDGKLVAAGFSGIGFSDNADFALARYNPDGSLDTSFGAGGIVTTDFNGVGDAALALVLQPDGKLVSAGYAYTGIFSQLQFALARYNPDGSLDTSFGSGGKVTTDFSGYGLAYAMVLQPDGKIVAAGTSGDFALARYNPDGSLDTIFGNGGTVTTDITGSLEIAFALALQPDDKLVAVGFEGFFAGFNFHHFALARYLGGSVTNPIPDITVTDSVPPVSDLQMPFGDVTEGHAADQTITITNDGNVNLIMGNVAQDNPLDPPFRILNNNCFGRAIGPSGKCTISVRFLPITTGSFSDAFEMSSNDPDENPVTVTVSGTGLSSITNNPPSIPNLVFPASGQTGLGTTVTFRWKISQDPDEDTVTYDFYYCTDQSFTGCSSIVVASLSENDLNYEVAGAYGGGVLLFGIVLAARVKGKKRIAILITMTIVTGAMLGSCDRGGDGAPSSSSDEVTHTVSGLETSTTYYWKVVTDDGNGGTRESETRSFNTK